jgi:outer membrane protein
MKNPIHTLFSLGALGAAAVIAQAQPAPKILVVDMAKIFDTHYETQAEKAKLDDATKKAQDQIDQMNKEGDALVAQYKELDEQSKNPAATADAKAKAVADAQKKGQEIQAKLADRNNLATNAKSVLQERIQKFRGTMLEEISKVVVTVAKRHDATLVVDKSGPTLLGVSPVIYFDPGYDITSEVVAEINKDRPAGTPAASATPAVAPAAAPATSTGSDMPKITVPGVTAPSK